MIQPHLDYCSQVWSPSTIREDLKSQEQVLRSFTRRIKGYQNMEYWDRLKALKIFSTQRRMERYRIIYVWKVIRGIVPDYGIKTNENNARLGRMVYVPNYKGSVARFKTLFEASLRIEGAKLYNCIPRHLRDFNGTKETFKHNLDLFLSSVPDEPAIDRWMVPSAMDYNCKPSNCLYDWVRHLQLYDYSIAMNYEAPENTNNNDY